LKVFFDGFDRIHAFAERSSWRGLQSKLRYLRPASLKADCVAPPTSAGRRLLAELLDRMKANTIRCIASKGTAASARL
jgi:hypothetical protein